MSDVELLAVILGSGSSGRSVFAIANDIYYSFGGLAGLYQAGIREIAELEGLGLKKAIKVLAALELGRRIIGKERISVVLSRPESVWRFVLADIAGLLHEVFIVCVLDSKNRIIKKRIITSGTVTETLVHPREIYKCAISETGASIIACHNHPSGELKASVNDIKVTERLVKTGRIIGIPLLDHVIVTEEGYLSLREEGYVD